MANPANTRNRATAAKPRRTFVAVSTRRFMRLSVLRGVLGALAFFALCEIVTLAVPIRQEYLPNATSILAELVQLAVDPTFLARIGNTLLTWAAGLCISIAIAVPTGIALGASAPLYRLVRTPLELIRPIPAVALIPLFILIFGQSFQANMWLVVYATVWPTLLNTIYGVHDTSQGARESARAFGLKRLEILVRVELPSALPLAFTGIRVSGAIALTVAVAAEMLVAKIGGLGSFITESSLTGASMAPTYAAVAAAGLLGLLINSALIRAQRLICPWQGEQEGVE